MKLISKRFYLGTMIGSMFAFICAIFASAFMAGMSEGGESAAADTLMLIGFLCVLVGVICWLALVHKLWSTIQYGNVRTTPGKAVALLFVPFFNIYWMFQVYWGWAVDYNNYIEDQGINAPRVSPGIPLAYCILAIASVIPLIGIITALFRVVLLFVFFNKAIDGANGVITHLAGGGQDSTPPQSDADETPPQEAAAETQPE